MTKQRTVICNYCGQPAELRDSACVYGGRSYGKIWYCGPDQAWVGVHKNSADHAPLGRLANAELRKWKQAAHAAFDPYWKAGKFNRTQAYRWLAGKLGIAAHRCHIGWFDVDMCQAVVNICQQEKETA